MRKFFQHIRRQPKSVRDNYALGIAGTFTSVVVLLWVVAFPSGGLLDAPEEEVEKLTPFATLISESKQGLASIRATLNNNASSSDSQAAVVTASTSSAPENIVLTEADIALAAEKASSTESGTSSPQTVQYMEVMIGTTTQSGTGSSTATTTQNSPSATVE